MARLRCKCGEELSNSTNPEIQYKLFTDKEWLTAIDKSEIGEKLLDIGRGKYTIWKCPNCERLYIFQYQKDTPLRIYNMEVNNGGDW